MRKPRGHFWTNKKKFGKKKFQGSYVTQKHDRYFLLTAIEGSRKVQLESWQMARSLGWTML
jgi:hypothetical protein